MMPNNGTAGIATETDYENRTVRVTKDDTAINLTADEALMLGIILIHSNCSLNEETGNSFEMRI